MFVDLKSIFIYHSTKLGHKNEKIYNILFMSEFQILE